MPAMAVLALALLAYMSAWFLVAVARRDNSLADVAWGGGFILMAMLALALGSGPTPRSLLATGLVVLWGGRLALHVAARNRGKGEDFRYAAWRRQWGRHWVWRSYLQVFLLQGLFLFVVALAVVRVNLGRGPALGWLDLAATLVWLVGFGFEAVGDWQLRRFTRDGANRGRVMDRGLWRTSRHPNYFGEALQWWGIWLFAAAMPGEWWTVVSPLAITWLLRFVSGVPLLERALVQRIPGYRDYQRRTSAILPLPPRRG